MTHVEALKREVEILKSRLQEHDTGHIHTAISVLQGRIEELETVTANKQDIQLSMAKCRMEMDSGYNDGWTREYYRKEYDRLQILYEST